MRLMPTVLLFVAFTTCITFYIMYLHVYCQWLLYLIPNFKYIVEYFIRVFNCIAISLQSFIYSHLHITFEYYLVMCDPLLENNKNKIKLKKKTMKRKQTI